MRAAEAPGKKDTQTCILTEAGELIERRVRTLAERFGEVLGRRPPACILLEASTEWRGASSERLLFKVRGLL